MDTILLSDALNVAANLTKTVQFNADQPLNFNQVVYDDIQVGVGRLTFPGVADPTWRKYNHGIGGGITFDVLGFALNDYIEFDLQTSHSMKLNTILDLHIHYMTPTDGTGDDIKFRLDVIASAINGNWAVPTGSPFTVNSTMAANYSNAHKLLEIADIPAVNSTVSTIYTCRLTRIAADGTDYAGEVYLKYIDSHYQKDDVGSKNEDSK